MTAIQAIIERMREAVQRHDRCVPDGRGFSTLTKQLHLKKPYDAEFTSVASRRCCLDVHQTPPSADPAPH